MKNLTFRYSMTQFTYWYASSGAAAFATAYLLDKGVPSGNVGLLLALAGLLSCLTQPVFAAIADRSRRFLLVKLMLALSGICCGCIALQLLPGLPRMLAAVVYALGIWSSDAMVPLLNAVSVAYNGGGYAINYGAARGIGSAASALTSLVIGWVIAKFGMTWMLALILLARLASMVVLVGYPKLEKGSAEAHQHRDSCSLFAFVRRYRWYCAAMLGIGFLGMYHAMTENYLIAIVGALGGDSGHAGTALFISAMVAAPVIFFFAKIREKFRDETLLKIAAISFSVKAVCFYFAADISTIYLLQLLQITSYGLLAPTQVYFARARVAPADMVKGQAFSTAAYALGCSVGNFAGGQLLGLGVKAVLAAGIAMALTGTLVLFVTVGRTDRKRL